MKKIYLLLTFILITSCTNSTKVVFLGDSITEAGIYDKEVGVPSGDTLIYPKYTGFITLLKKDIEDDIELIGKGVSGNKVSNLLERYKKDVLSLNPDIVFIYIGINDVWHKYSFGTGTDIIFYENGLRKIITDLKNKGSRVILCTPTVIGENKGEFTLVNEFKDIETMEIMNGDLDAYSDVIRKLASELNTDLLDLREIFMNYISENNPNNESSGITTYDGVHLNDLGNKLIADEMLRFIN
jgi:lysophospholipase L1-like esterase|tara:strand:+ start:837 stop:1559 length:723 start_codon:yes stop_codon:yes gene_type:complete